MSKRRDLETQIHSLDDIREIMNAMKNLSLMETHRLSRFLDTQRRVVTSIEAAADDFFSFYPHLFPREEGARRVSVLIGSERGFCGDFNESLLRALNKDAQIDRERTVIIVGSKLAAKVGADAHVAASIDGAGVAEEVQPVLVRLMDALSGPDALPAEPGPLHLTVFHHQGDDGTVRVSELRPFRPPDAKSQYCPYPPMLNVAAESFLAGMAEQYLVAALHEFLYSSLMAENQRRMRHMDGAVRRLERTSSDLLRRRNILRQEEITEEIEIIMLSVEAFGLAELN